MGVCLPPIQALLTRSQMRINDLIIIIIVDNTVDLGHKPAARPWLGLCNCDFVRLYNQNV